MSVDVRTGGTTRGVREAVRPYGPLVLAGLFAEALFVVVGAPVDAVVSSFGPEGPGSDGLGWQSVLVNVVSGYVALVVPLAATGRRQPWLLATVALPAAGGLAGAGLWGTLDLLGGPWWLPLLFALLAVASGPVSTVVAGLLVEGRALRRLLLVPAVALAVVGLVALDRTASPWVRAHQVADAVAQPYRYAASDARLRALGLEDYTGRLQLGYDVGDHVGDHDRFLGLDESDPLPAAARAARCAPDVGDDDEPICDRLPSPAGTGIWWAAEGVVVVARPDATVVLTGDVPDAATARALVARLRPADPAALVDEAQDVRL